MVLKSDILTPIQTGCANTERLFDGMLHDDDGENISAENPKYNELSAQYWAWKNYDKLGKPDYVDTAEEIRSGHIKYIANMPIIQK